MTTETPPRGVRARSIVYMTRAGVWAVGTVLIVAAGYAQTPLGVAVVAFHTIVIYCAVRDFRRQALPSVGWGILDVAMPAALGVIGGYEPSWVHLVIAAQVAGAFLAPRPKYALVIGGAGLISILMGLALDPLPPLIVLSQRGFIIVHYGAIGLGLALGAAVTMILGRRVWLTRERLAAAAESDRRNARTQRRFISMVSHELRTPLTSIQGYAELLADRGEYPEAEIDEFTDAIRSQASHLSRLVDDVLVVLKAEAGRLDIVPVPVDIRQVVSRIDAMVAVVPPKRLSVEAPDDVFAHADVDRLFQVIRNLVENAVKYGGDHIHLSVEQTSDCVRIVVADDGPGIPADRMELAFTEFGQVHEPASTSAGGFGLGLPIVRRLITAMGGDVRYRPPDAIRPGGFIVDLPRAAELSAPKPAAAIPFDSTGPAVDRQPD
jgi:signal transduction histidine kinase